MKKKYSAVDLTDLAIGILILGIVVVIGANVLLTLRDNRLTDLSSTTTVNETTNSVMNWSGVVLDNIWVSSVDACYNASMAAPYPIPATNWTYSVDPINGYATVSATTGLGGENNSLWNCTYTRYDTTRPDWALPNDAAIGIAEYGNWFDIIVIVGIAGLILALIFLSFGRRGEEGGVAY